MSQNRLLLVVVLGIAAVAVLFGIYGALPPPSRDSVMSVSNPSAEPELSPPVSRVVPGQSKAAIQQSPDARRNPDARQVQDLNGATIEMCHGALLGKKYIQASVDDDCSGIAEGDDIGMQLCRRALVSDHAYLQELTAKAAGCPESLAHASDYYISLRNAALGGDINAQECFISGYFHDRDSGNSITKEQAEEYVPLARQFIQSAFERGDWGVVHRLAGTWVDNPGLLIEAYPYGISDLETFYKMNYLLSLGARDNVNSEDALRIVGATRRNGKMSAAQMKAAEDWARETYAQYFAGTVYEKKAAASSFCESD